MKAKNLVLPGMALGAAALLLVPGQEAHGWSLIGGDLDIDQRDVRVYNNFSDPESNDNLQTKFQFSGYVGAEMAIWKGVVEWGSEVHGNGTGDNTQTQLGDGGANFDAMWCGNATAVGTTNQNIASAVNSCSAGTIAFCETPISDGWRIRFCDGNFKFDDGPGQVVGNAFDIQGIMTHEYGHALGMGHSAVGGTTMFPSGSTGSEAERSIEADDMAGLQFLYGVKSPLKPKICGVFINGSTVTLRGHNFDPTDNQVFFTRSAASNPGIGSPRIIIGAIPSINNGTELSLTIPAAAGPGDIAMKIPGSDSVHRLMSNAHPTNLVNNFRSTGICDFNISSVMPNTVDALVPGTGQFMTVTGEGFFGVREVVLEPSTVLDPSSWTIVDDNTITVDLPQAAALGTNTLTLDSEVTTVSVNFNVVEPASPKFQVGTGDPLNFTQNGSSMRVIVSGTVGTQHRVFYSTSPVSSSVPIFTVQLGNNFTELFVGPTFTIPASGYFEHFEPVDVGGMNITFFAQAVDITTAPAPAFATSNLQSIVIGP